VSDQDSHPHKTTGKVVVLYILIFNFFDSKLEEKIKVIHKGKFPRNGIQKIWMYLVNNYLAVSKVSEIEISFPCL
jgi:hypothetical protein